MINIFNLIVLNKNFSFQTHSGCEQEKAGKPKEILKYIKLLLSDYEYNIHNLVSKLMNAS